MEEALSRTDTSPGGASGRTAVDVTTEGSGFTGDRGLTNTSTPGTLSGICLDRFPSLFHHLVRILKSYFDINTFYKSVGEVKRSKTVKTMT